MSTLYIYLLLFGCIGYLIATDESIAKAVTLSLQIVKFQFDKTKWIIMNNPKNPIVRWIMWKRAYKLAEELQKELQEKSK